MSQVSLRARNVEARRQRILGVARGLIAEGGLAALTMRPLAAQAGLSVTTLYNLFGRRSEILHALVSDAIDRMDETLELEAPLDDPIERCRAVVTVSVRHLAEHEAIFRPVLLARAEAPVHADAPRSISDRAARMQSIAIEAAIGQGLLLDLLDPELLGAQIFHGYELAASQWAAGAIDEQRFAARALYGLFAALLGVATPSLRPRIEAELQTIESALHGDPEWKSRSRFASSAN